MAPGEERLVEGVGGRLQRLNPLGRQWPDAAPGKEGPCASWTAPTRARLGLS